MASSPLFWLIALVLVAGILAWLVRPLLRRATTVDAPEDVSATTAVYRDHKRQVEADLAAGAITQQEHDAAVAEVTRRFGEELAQGSEKSTHVSSTHGSERTRWIAAM